MKRNSWGWWLLVSSVLVIAIICECVCMYAIHAAATAVTTDQRTPFVILAVVCGMTGVVGLGTLTFIMCYAKKKDEQEFETL